MKSARTIKQRFAMYASLGVLLTACGANGSIDVSSMTLPTSGSVATTAPSSPLSSLPAVSPPAVSPPAVSPPAVSPPASTDPGGSDPGGSDPGGSEPGPQDPIDPVISFGNRETNWSRPFEFVLDAASNPPIPLSYAIIAGDPQAANDENCVVNDGVLSFNTDRPNLPAACMVEVSATSVPDGYLTPDPVKGLVKIKLPSWQVNASSVEVKFSEQMDGQLEVEVDENSGDAFGMFVYPDSGNTGNCSYLSTDPASPSPPGTTLYRVKLQLAEPVNGQYICSLAARATPPDYAGANLPGSFTVTVDP